MEPARERKIERKQDTDPDSTDRVLRDIAEDARALRDRYLDETIVPEGGE